MVRSLSAMRDDASDRLRYWFAAWCKTDLSVMLRPFGSLLLCLLVFLHRFLLFLGCLGLRLLLFLSRLLSLARTVWAGEDLSVSRYRPCETRGDQQYESSNSLHDVPGTQEPTPILHEVASGPQLRIIAEHYTSNAQELAYCRAVEAR